MQVSCGKESESPKKGNFSQYKEAIIFIGIISCSFHDTKGTFIREGGFKIVRQFLCWLYDREHAQRTHGFGQTVVYLVTVNLPAYQASLRGGGWLVVRQRILASAHDQRTHGFGQTFVYLVTTNLPEYKAFLRGGGES